MSLTRDQWIEMWKAIKKIESHTKIKNRSFYSNQDFEYDIGTIKELIQSVIGQLE